MSNSAQRAARRAKVEGALIEAGGALDVSALARELGVPPTTIKRDVTAIRARWAASEPALDAERARLVAVYEAVAAAAWDQYRAIVEETPQHATAASCLRIILNAHAKRASLLGLDEPHEPDDEDDNVVIVRYVDRLGQVHDSPPRHYPDEDYNQ